MPSGQQHRTIEQDSMAIEEKGQCQCRRCQINHYASLSKKLDKALEAGADSVAQFMADRMAKIETTSHKETV